MTRLDKVLKLLDNYNKLANLSIDEARRYLAPSTLEKLRKKKDQLIQESIEHDCRRKK